MASSKICAKVTIKLSAESYKYGGVKICDYIDSLINNAVETMDTSIPEVSVKIDDWYVDYKRGK